MALEVVTGWVSHAASGAGAVALAQEGMAPAAFLAPVGEEMAEEEADHSSN